jgi:hypothetical protein
MGFSPAGQRAEAQDLGAGAEQAGEKRLDEGLGENDCASGNR